jgi:hypothetical protein
MRVQRGGHYIRNDADIQRCDADSCSGVDANLASYGLRSPKLWGATADQKQLSTPGELRATAILIVSRDYSLRSIPAPTAQHGNPPQSNLEELAQPTMPGQKPKSLRVQNITDIVIANTGNGAQLQLHGARAQTHVVKLPPGDMVRLGLIEPMVVHITER